MLVASWRMDRLETLHINPWSAPGLMPGVLGALMILFGAALGLRGPKCGDLSAPGRASARRVALALALCVGYAGGLLGRGLPFWLTSALFMCVLILAFRWLDRDPGARTSLARLAVTSAVIALVCAVMIGLLFEQVFLVRLP